MTNSNHTSWQSLVPRSSSRGIALIFLFLTFCGFVDAAYLTVEHYLGVIPPCSVSQGCEKVLVSEYAVVGGVPVALIGSFYYLLLFLFAVASLSSEENSNSDRFLRLAAKITPLGFMSSLWFVYLQFFVIHAICIYCLISATISTLLFVIGMSFLVICRQASHQSDKIM